MNPKANPLDYLIQCAEQGLIPEKFDILNAKDELNQLRNSKQFDLACWGRINSRGDLYDPSIVFNPHLNQDTVLPLYANREEFKAKYDKLSK